MSTVEMNLNTNLQVNEAVRTWLDRNGFEPRVKDELNYKLKLAEALAVGCEADGDGLSGDAYLDLLEETKTMKSPNPEKVFGGVKSAGTRARVKAAGESYSTEKSVGIHPKTQKPVVDEHGHPALLPSEYENAMAGALFKRLAQKAGLREVELTDHDRQLLGECFESDWCGQVGGEWHDRIDGMRCKALLDDATSGGLEAVPVWYDANVVSYPLLGGEIFPFVDLVEVPRGRRIEGSAVGNPTLTWGQAEGSAITCFDTANLVADLNTTVFPVMVAIEVGRDFMADAPANIGAILTANIGQRLANELDHRILSGNGTTQIEGVTAATGTTAVAKSGGAGSDWVVDDVENVAFSVEKQYRNRALNPCFMMNDTTYSRIRGIEVGAADARRVFGMSHNDYSLLDWPARIEGNLPNATMVFGCLKKYRLFRRAGLGIEWSTQGRTLMLSNLALLVARGRFGGRVVDPSGFALITTGQA